MTIMFTFCLLCSTYYCYKILLYALNSPEWLVTQSAFAYMTIYYEMHEP